MRNKSKQVSRNNAWELKKTSLWDWSGKSCSLARHLNLIQSTGQGSCRPHRLCLPSIADWRSCSFKIQLEPTDVVQSSIRGYNAVMLIMIDNNVQSVDLEVECISRVCTLEIVYLVFSWRNNIIDNFEVEVYFSTLQAVHLSRVESPFQRNSRSEKIRNPTALTSLSKYKDLTYPRSVLLLYCCMLVQHFSATGTRQVLLEGSTSRRSWMRELSTR